MTVPALDSGSPRELALGIDASLKSLLVLVGQSLKAKSRLQAALQLVQNKAAISSTSLSQEELILLQYYPRGHNNQIITRFKEIERECFLYDGLVKKLADWIGIAKKILEQELINAKAREEAERIVREQREQEVNAKRLAEQKVEADAAEQSSLAAGNKADADQARESIVIEDDEEDDEDDAPLAKRAITGEQADSSTGPTAAAAIDLTDDSPLGGKTIPLASEDATAPPSNNTSAPAVPDPTALLNSLSAFNQANTDSALGDSMALDKFDFSQFGLQNMDSSSGFAADTTLPNQFATNPLDFSMDFLDYSALGGADGDGGDGGMGSSTDLFGNIDFSALLAGNTETKKN